MFSSDHSDDGRESAGEGKHGMSLRRFFRRWWSDAELLQQIDSYLTDVFPMHSLHARGLLLAPTAFAH
jgi:hypothetical protein